MFLFNVSWTRAFAHPSPPQDGPIQQDEHNTTNDKTEQVDVSIPDVADEVNEAEGENNIEGVNEAEGPYHDVDDDRAMDQNADLQPEVAE